MNNYAKALLFALAMMSKGYAGEDPVQEARQSLGKGEVKAAIITLKTALQDTPNNGDARLLLGEIYLRQGDGDSAVKELEKSKELNMPKEKWIIALAQAYLLQNKPQNVLDKLQPDAQLPAAINANLYAVRGMAYLGLKDDAKATESLNAALKADPDSAEALLGLTMMELSKQQYKKAIDYAIQATSKAPKNLQAWNLLAESKRAGGDSAGAVEAYSHGLELQPNNIKMRLGRAATYIAMAKMQEARQDVDAAKKMGAANVPMVLYTEALLDFQAGKLDLAHDNLIKVNNSAPEHVPTLFLLGSIAYQKNENEQAEYYLSKVIGMAPGYLQAIKLLAATRLKRGNPSEAIDLLKPWVEKQQNDAQLFAVLGSAYLKNRQYDLGVNYLSKAAEIAPDLASVRAELGLGRIAAGKMDQGVNDLKNAVNIDPNLMEADATIILALVQQKKYDEAIAEATKLKAKRKNDPLADNLLGVAYMSKGDLVHARESWQNALLAKPDYTPASLNLAKLAISQNKPDDATKEYEKLLKHDPDNLSGLIGMAQLAELRKDYPKMAEWLEEARKKNPKEEQPAIMLTRFYLSQRKADRALQIAIDASAGSPENLGLLQNLGVAQLGANQAANAATTFRQLLIKVPNNPEVHFQLATALIKLGDKNEGSKELDEALKRGPEYIPAMLAKADLSMHEQKYADVLKTADVIKTKYPKSPLGYQLEGDAVVAQKQLDKASAAYSKAYEFSPSSYLARRLFAVRRELKLTSQAYDGMKQWLDKSPQDADSWALMAAALQEDGKAKEAATAYEKAYELRPSSIVVQNNLAWLYQQMGDKKALEFAEKLASTPGIENKSEVLDTIGWVFVQNGKENKGLVLLQQATLQDNSNPSVRFHLASAYLKGGKRDEAKKELERVLKEGKSFPERAQATELLKGL
jgi:putative PEP-CTERM system TPR-repeat lipoprotein